jgi:hypothetical protein
MADSVPRCRTFGCASAAVGVMDIVWAVGIRDQEAERTPYCQQHAPTEAQLAILRGIVTGTLPAAHRPSVVTRELVA